MAMECHILSRVVIRKRSKCDVYVDMSVKLI